MTRCHHENVFEVHLGPVENDFSFKPRCGRGGSDSFAFTETQLAFETYILRTK